MVLLSSWPSSVSLPGVAFALTTAVFWAISPLFWASASRRIGSFPVVLLRSLLAALILLAGLPLYALLAGGWPAWTSGQQVFWLSVSSFFGLAVGDALLYEAFVLLGARRTTQVLMLSPVSAVLLGWICLDETLSLRVMAGIAVVLTATWYAVLGGRRPGREASREPGRISAGGLAIATAGALCVGVGAVGVRQAYAVGPLDSYMATLVRVSSAAAMMWLVPLARRRCLRTLEHLRDRVVLSRVIPGTFAGPVLGMITYLAALKYAQAGVVSTISSTSPLFILPVVAVVYRVRIGVDVVAATIMALGGLALISWPW